MKKDGKECGIRNSQCVMRNWDDVGIVPYEFRH